jgi:hypothetical protein
MSKNQSLSNKENRNVCQNLIHQINNEHFV